MDDIAARRIFHSLRYQLLFERIFLVSKTIQIGNTLKHSHFLLIYTAAVVSVYIICVATALGSVSNRINETSWSTSYLWYFIVVSSNIMKKISFLVAVIIMSLQSKPQIQFFQKLIQIDSILWCNFSESIKDGFIRKRVIVRTTLSAINVLLSTFARFWHAIDLKTINYSQIISNMLPFFLETMLNLWILFAFVTYVDAIRYRLQLISCLIDKIQQSNDRNATNQQLPIILFLLMEVHTAINIICKMFGIILIIRLGNDFVDLLLCTYMFLLVLLDTTTLPSYFWSICLLWMILITAKYIQAFLFAEMIQTQVKKCHFRLVF